MMGQQGISEALATTGHSVLRISDSEGRTVVVKQALEQTERSTKRWMSELSALRLSSGHPNIIELLSSDQGQLSLTFAYELGTSLDQLVDPQSFSLLNSASCDLLSRQMISALAFLHERAIIHDDVKPHNILWSAGNSKATLIDFGAALLPQWTFSPSGTPAYVAPEFLDRAKDPKGDIWALGVTMAFARRCVPLPEGEWFLPDVFEQGAARDALLAWLESLRAVRAKLERDGHALNASMLEEDLARRPSSGDLAAQLPNSAAQRRNQA